jgi:hypothetical protein
MIQQMASLRPHLSFATEAILIAQKIYDMINIPFIYRGVDEGTIREVRREWRYEVFT